MASDPHDKKNDPRDKKNKTRRLSRRAFLKSAGAAAAVAGLVGVAPESSPAASTDFAGGGGNGPSGANLGELLGPGAVTIVLNVNGAARTLALEPRVTLLAALRDRLGLTGPKLVCDRGACGACTVLLDGAPVVSCLMLAVDARAHAITTIEGLGARDRMHPVQAAFVAEDALQCGFCTPGMIMSITAALSRNPNATRDEIKRAVAGNICRCGTYPHVFNAALAVASHLRGAKPPAGVA
jgi:xanthine dehydrogenase YagT iron-sulfur-binding subunit